MTTTGKGFRSYMEVLETILKACPNTKTTLYTRAGISWGAFIGQRYLQLLLKRGLISHDANHEQMYPVRQWGSFYTLTAKGERYLKLIAEAKELLGIGG